MGRVGEGRLDVRGVDCEDRLLRGREAVLWRLRVGGGRHGRRGRREARVVDGGLLLGARQVERRGGLVLMVLDGAGCRVTSTVLALLLSSGGG